MLADYDKIGIGENDPETFERKVTKKFVQKRAQTDEITHSSQQTYLTGFDAPPATYLYIDKTMK